MEANHLAEYLRARRSLLRPEDVGLARQGRRRVPGLRREELAMLAGISPDYYLRLEQGRDNRPSERVLDALAEALRLDTDATRYLHQLGRPSRPAAGERQAERPSAGLASLVNGADDMPVYVLGRLRDVLLLNPLAAALLPILREGENQLRAMFLDPRARQLYRDWESMAETGVASLRAITAPNLDEPGLDALVRDLSERSNDFRCLWARHDVRLRATDVARFDHPAVGYLELRYELLAAMGTEGHVLVLYYAEPGSPSEEALSRLKKLVSPATVPRRKG
jgi:transcriptional regulator with XRE-family HTH domain